MTGKRVLGTGVVDRRCMSTYRYANVTMVTSSEQDVLCDNSVTNVRRNARLPTTTLVAEAAGAALVAFGALGSGAVAHRISGVGLAATYLTTSLLGLCVLAAMLLTSDRAGGHAHPMVPALCIDDLFDPDDAVRVILAQLGGAAVTGVIFGLLGISLRAPLACGLGAEAIVSACVVATALAARTRAADVLVAITASAALGPTCIGNPAVALGVAVAASTEGAPVTVGAILGAQLVGAAVGAAFAAAMRDTSAIAPTTEL
jgi:hypothetical protein